MRGIKAQQNKRVESDTITAPACENIKNGTVLAVPFFSYYRFFKGYYYTYYASVKNAGEQKVKLHVNAA